VKIIIDSNILFSAIIKDSIHRRLILEYDDFFLFPAYLFVEMQKHKNLLVTKSKLSETDFNLLVGIFLQKIIMIPDVSIEEQIKKAHDIVKNIDVDDKVFISCALAFPGSILWSNDKELKRQNDVMVINTSEFKEFLKDNSDSNTC
jgi:predicted nucleic acid-binding protein